MEDFIKRKLDGYKPEFKEEYWEAVAKDIRKRKRRPFVLWVFIGLVAANLGALAWFVLRDQTETFQFEDNTSMVQMSNNEKINSNDLESNSKNVEEEFISEDRNNIAKAADSHEADIAAQQMSGYTQRQLDETSVKHMSEVSAINFDYETQSYSAGIKKVNNEIANKQENRLIDDKTNGKISSAVVLKEEAIQYKEEGFPKAHRSLNENIWFAPFLEIRVFEQEIVVNEVAILEPDNNHEPDIFIPRQSTFSLGIRGHYFSAFGEDFWGQGIFLSKTFPIGRKHNYFLEPSLGFDRFAGNFQSVEKQTVNYRSFGQNQIMQSLDPDQLCLMNAGISAGVYSGEWRFMFKVQAGYLLGVRGRKVETEMIQSVSTINTQDQYTVNSTTTQSISDQIWLDTKNLKPLNYSLGTGFDRYIGQRWRIGAAIEYFPMGLVQFERIVDNSESIIGENDLIKGGVYVQYEF